MASNRGFNFSEPFFSIIKFNYAYNARMINPEITSVWEESGR